MESHPNDPHRGMPVRTAGASAAGADAAVILVHGRGGSADDILSLASVLVADLHGGERIAFLAPQANGFTWYPFSFLSPIAANEPGISSGIAVLARLVDDLEAAGVPRDRVVLGGFSQGACLALEYAGRYATRFGGILGFSGGLIGPVGSPREYPGHFAGTPVFLGCSDVDPHIPAARVEETSQVLGRMGALVDRRFYKGMGHSINEEEILAGRALLEGVLARRANS